MRKGGVAAIGLAVIVAAAAVGLGTNSLGVWREATNKVAPTASATNTTTVPPSKTLSVVIERGPLRLWGPDPESNGLTIHAGYPLGQKLYYAVPATAGADLIIDRVELVEASPGVRLTGAYVSAIRPGSRTTMTLADSGAFIGPPWPGRYSDLPGEIHGYACCEPQREILLELVFDTPGAHTIGRLGFDYEAGLLRYHTVITLAVTPDL